MSRRWLLPVMIMVGLLAGMVGYSLVGAITGVYRFPELDVIDPKVRSYLVWEQNHWACMMLNLDGKTIYLAPEIDKMITVSQGVWTRTVTRARSLGTDQVNTPWNLFDVYRIRFGRGRLTVSPNFPVSPLP
ncbi:MAG TPA: hypothetical protein VHX44_07845 [Planctomycetota bacterium]|nr:hypothetical protein [Planctomycetota bacterium]